MRERERERERKGVRVVHFLSSWHALDDDDDGMVHAF